MAEPPFSPIPGPRQASTPVKYGGTVTEETQRDEVDRIVAAWQRERPDLDLSPLEVLSRITRLARHLDRARKSAFDLHGLEAWSFDVLAALRRSGEPYQLSPGQLALETMVTSGTMTNRLDRLEELGWVNRHPDPTDGRSILVRLTGAGARCVDEALTDLLAKENELLQDLPLADRTLVAGILSKILAPIDAE
jgi:DNA-binding MarR family transcriptional regulator